MKEVGEGERRREREGEGRGEKEGGHEQGDRTQKGVQWEKQEGGEMTCRK